MILKIINILTSNLTKNLLIFVCLTLSLSTFSKDIHPHILKKSYITLEYDIDYDSVLPPNINTENETNSLESPTINDEYEISLLVSPNINTEHVFIYESTSSNSSNAEIIFEEEYQPDYPVFDDYNSPSSQEYLPVNSEVESELSSNSYLSPRENHMDYSSLSESESESENNLFILNPGLNTSTKLELELD